MTASYFSRALSVFVLACPLFATDARTANYLALGDSIAFGLDIQRLGVPGTTAYSFIGYPEVFASAASDYRKVLNAACPGETSTSFITGGAFLCVGFTRDIGLRAQYSVPQLSYATSVLEKNRNIRLVTFGIGGNDLLDVEAACLADAKKPAPLYEDLEACFKEEMPKAITMIVGNVNIVLGQIRTVGKYRGTLVVVNQYSPSANPLYVNAVAALNDALAQIAGLHTARVADAFTAFRLASSRHGFDPCAAGLLPIIQTPAGPVCDVHPTAFGQKVLAAAVAYAVYARQ